MTCEERRRSGYQTSSLANRGDARSMKARPAPSRNLCDPVEKLRCQSEGNAAVAGPVLMDATEAVAGVPQEQGTGSHHFAARGGAILKTPANHDRHRSAAMLFFERPVLWAGFTNDVGYCPTLPRRELARLGRSFF